MRFIENITDVGHLTADDIAQGDSGEDKMLKKAAAEHKTPQEIALFYEKYFFERSHDLNIVPAQYYPRATAHIPQMIKLIETLIERGHAYEINGNVFYDVTSFPEYGKLSGNTLENLKVGARLEEHPDKRHPWDFALWLKAPEGHLMHWSSPWSEGYPGWHIECSAMSIEYLGDTFDIHTGGEDHIFPHHEAEIAQSEGATGKPFVRFFLHARHILVEGEKMSKSKGNFYTLEDIVGKGFTPMDLRLLYLSSHYRSQMNFTWDALQQAKKNLTTLNGTYARLESCPFAEGTGAFAGEEIFEKFQVALEDDLNTPLALSHLLQFAKELNSAIDAKAAVSEKARFHFEIMTHGCFGLLLERKESPLIPENITDLANARQKARESKDFAEADRLRQEIEATGFTVEDTEEGYNLRAK